MEIVFNSRAKIKNKYLWLKSLKMSFIDKKDPVVLSIMLTSKGRELLSTGELTFKYFTVGDSEIDYDFIREINNESDIDSSYNVSDLEILRPRDKNPKILSYISKNVNSDQYNTISPIPSFPYDITNTIESIGFFNNSGNTFIIDSDHIKQPDTMVYMNTVAGGKVLRLRKSPTYGIYLDEPNIGDLLLIKWTYDLDTTGYTINKNSPTPYLMYKIVNKVGLLSNDSLILTVDRNLPNFSLFAPTGIIISVLSCLNL